MGPNFPGGSPSGGPWTHDDGGGKRRKRKKKGFFRCLVELIVGVILTFAFCALALALPLLLQFDPWDAQQFVDASGDGLRGTMAAKVDAFMDGWRHKQGMSEMTFFHDGKSITFTDTNGTLTGMDANGYDYDEGGEYESDLAEMRRILKEWGLD